MSPFLSAVAVLLGVAVAGNVQSDASASIAQIRDTLKNLLRSIEDNGRDAEALFGKRQLWCDSATKEFAAANDATAASLSNMQSQLTETQAEVAESEGSVKQVKVDIEMVQHTIKQTQDMLTEQEASGNKKDGSLVQAKSLVDNKQLSLASLQAQLEVAVPALSQLQARVAETKQQISYRTDSLESAKDFVVALKDGCQVAADRADSQSAARVGESNAIHAALQGLEGMGSTKVASEDSEATPLSFVQMREQEVSTDDLTDLFAASQEMESAAVSRKARRQPRAATAKAAPPLRPRIDTLLAQLKHAESADGQEQSTWCSKQRESSSMALKFAQDSLGQIASEMAAHSEAESEFSEQLKKLQTLSAAVTDSSKTALDQAGQEKALIKSSQKDQQLATKILDQAMTILKELGIPKAVTSLDSAKKMLAKQAQAAVQFEQESSVKAKTIGEKALALTQTQEEEQHDLEFARDDHASQRMSLIENKALYENDAQEATAYKQKLEDSCKVDADVEANQQRSVQVHALEDADKALDGKLTEAKSSSVSLRGNDASSAKATQNLTPMQRAALEMGVSTD